MLKSSDASLHPATRAGSLETVLLLESGTGRGATHLRFPGSARIMKRRDFLTRSALAGAAGSLFQDGRRPSPVRHVPVAQREGPLRLHRRRRQGRQRHQRRRQARRDRRPLRRRRQHARQDGREVPQGQEVLRLPQDARGAGRQDRRRHRQHARPHARPGQRHGHADGQALLLPEAADLVGRGGPRHARARRREEALHPDGQPGHGRRRLPRRASR